LRQAAQTKKSVRTGSAIMALSALRLSPALAMDATTLAADNHIR
jgi:hypothetical protein